MNQIDQYAHLHPYLCLFWLWLFSNAALYLPPPVPASSGFAAGFYKWVFGLSHAIAGAIPRIASNFLPADSVWGKILSGGNGLTNGNGTSGNGAKPPQQG